MKMHFTRTVLKIEPIPKDEKTSIIHSGRNTDKVVVTYLKALERLGKRFHIFGSHETVTAITSAPTINNRFDTRLDIYSKNGYDRAYEHADTDSIHLSYREGSREAKAVLEALKEYLKE